MEPERAVLSARLLAGLGLLASPALAQVFVVDAAGGPGSHFRDLPRAVASVPDGAVLRVRAGDYSAFVLRARALSIVGEGRVRLARGGVVLVLGTSPTQAVHLQGLELPVLGLEVKDCKGPVTVERCKRTQLTLIPRTDVRIERCAHVQIHECDLASGLAFAGISSFAPSIVALDSFVQVSASTVRGHPGAGASFRFPGHAGGRGLSLTRSRCLLVGSRVIGGTGGPGCRSCGLPGCAADGGPGGIGVELHQATLVCLGSPIAGGAGGARACCGSQCVCPGNGGDGLVAQDSTIYVLGTEPTGGPPGGSTCNARTGRPGRLRGRNEVHVDPRAIPPVTTITGARARGQRVAIEVTAAPGGAAVLVASRDPTLLALEPFVFGSILARIEIQSDPFVVPANGKHALGWTVPGSFELGRAWHVQHVTLDTQGLWVSNTAPFLLARGSRAARAQRADSSQPPPRTRSPS